MRRKEAISFDVQKVNFHLLDVLQENYYIELGYVNLDILNLLLDGSEVKLENLCHNETLVSGVGKISNDRENDDSYQFNYIFSMHQKSSSSKFVLTCGTVKYYDFKNNEKFAPIILIPITINYTTKMVVIDGDPVINDFPIHYNINVPKFNRAFSQIRDLKNESINSVFDIDNICEKYGAYLNCPIDAENYLTIIDVEYLKVPEFNLNIFNDKPSLYEKSDVDILKKYFKDIKAILPSNIEQKLILNKVHDGENVIVSGKYGTGKSQTIINIIADQISDHHKVLYINQDLNNLSNMRNDLVRLGLEKYIYVLSNNIFDQIVEVNKEKSLPERKNFDFVLKELKRIENIYNQRYAGYFYSEIIEELAEKHAVGRNNCMNDLPILEKAEFKKVYEYLKIYEESLKTIDPFPENVWLKLASSNTSITVVDIKKAIENFYQIHFDLVKKVNEFVKNYHLKDITMFTEIGHMIDAIFKIRKIMPTPIWHEENFLDIANKSVAEIAKGNDIHFDLMTFYNKFLTPDYKSGNMALYLKAITNGHYNLNEDAIYLDRILSSNGNISKLSKNVESIVKESSSAYKIIKEFFYIEDSSKELFIFLENFLNVFKTKSINSDWIDIAVIKDIKSKIKNLKIEYESLEKYYNKISVYFTSELSFKLLDDVCSSRFCSFLIKKYIDKRKLKIDHLSMNDFVKLVRQYHEQVMIILNILSPYKTIEIKDFEQMKSFIGFVMFYNSFTQYEEKIFLKLIRQNKLTMSPAFTIILKELTKLSDNQKLIKPILEQFNYYGIKISGNDFIELIKSMNDSQGYLKTIENTRILINNTFLPNNSRTAVFYKEIRELMDLDEKYLKQNKEMLKKEELYKSLFGSFYRRYETDTNEIYYILGQYKVFKSLLNDNDDYAQRIITNCISFEERENFFLQVFELDELHASWINAFRDFKACFCENKSSFSNETLCEEAKILQKYIDSIDQLEKVYQIEKQLDYYTKLGLNALVENIRKGEVGYQEGIAEFFKYSLFYNIYLKFPISNVDSFEFNEVLSTFKEIKEIEQNNCDINLHILKSRIKELNNFKKPVVLGIDSKLKNIKQRHKIFLADISDLASLNQLNFFDIVIVDDAHLVSLNKISKVCDFKHVVLFGDKSFKLLSEKDDEINENKKTQTKMTLLKKVKAEQQQFKLSEDSLKLEEYTTENVFRHKKSFSNIDDSYIIYLSKRYLKMPAYFGNKWNHKNCYIYEESYLPTLHAVNSIKAMVERIVKDYNEGNSINIVVADKNSRRNIYSSLVNLLSLEYPYEVVIKILNNKINIISANFLRSITQIEKNYKIVNLNDDNKIADKTYIWYPDFIKLDKRVMALAFSNYAYAKKGVMFYYLVKKTTRRLAEYENDFQKIINVNDSYNKKIIKPITRLLFNSISLNLEIVKPDIKFGLGYIDLFIKTQDIKVAVIVLGKSGEFPYSLYDDYRFYIEEYRRYGFIVETFTMEMLFREYDECVNKIVSIFLGDKDAE